MAENTKRIYETLVLVDPEFGRIGERAVEHVQSFIEKRNGEIIRIEKYAEQKLAYTIKNFKRGVYVLAAFRMEPGDVMTVNRDFNLDDHVLRSLILDRTGVTVEQFFRHYEASEEPHDEYARM